MKKNIIFICNGNIHRSVVAEYCLGKVLKEKGLTRQFTTASYGLQGTRGTIKPLHKNLKEYSKEYKAALPALNKFGIDISDHSFQKITPTVAKKATVIIAMDQKVYLKNQNSLLKQFPKLQNRMHLFSELTKSHRDIKDPSGSGSKKLHQSIIQNIWLAINNNVNTILRWGKV